MAIVTMDAHGESLWRRGNTDQHHRHRLHVHLLQVGPVRAESSCS
ncbi:MAG: hypothetical protein M3P29_04375 [Acidobacteriota bacterium]|nr:hypothetical protein [Acidobacteriota bacterium]